MTFQIVWSENSIKQLNKLDKHIAKRIIIAVEKTAENPYRHVKKIVGLEVFRLRIGDYRIFLDIDKKEMRILILKIGHRSNIYGH